MCAGVSRCFLVLRRIVYILLNSTCVLCTESLRQTNLMMKERFEGLAVWREKQREERDFLESRLEEARVRMEALTRHNRELSGKTGNDGNAAGAAGELRVRKS